jgi:hypothetical protein
MPDTNLKHYGSFKALWLAPAGSFEFSARSIVSASQNNGFPIRDRGPPRQQHHAELRHPSNHPSKPRESFDPGVRGVLSRFCPVVWRSLQPS